MEDTHSQTGRGHDEGVYQWYAPPPTLMES
ncbi:hypothetical protein HDA30_001323 [Micrococcus cohnii]|uniref:Uncharacterized protein n=1 Tax=Micrococcus cohnii TaxID=993416 RepID=A0A7W7GPD0_9MICC|nr:hypothetical protein [Micrococcus cohnii]